MVLSYQLRAGIASARGKAVGNQIKTAAAQAEAPDPPDIASPLHSAPARTGAGVCVRRSRWWRARRVSLQSPRMPRRDSRARKTRRARVYPHRRDCTRAAGRASLPPRRACMPPRGTFRQIPAARCKSDPGAPDTPRAPCASRRGWSSGILPAASARQYTRADARGLPTENGSRE